MHSVTTYGEGSRLGRLWSPHSNKQRQSTALTLRPSKWRSSNTKRSLSTSKKLTQSSTSSTQSSPNTTKSQFRNTINSLSSIFSNTKKNQLRNTKNNIMETCNSILARRNITLSSQVHLWLPGGQDPP